MSLTEEALPTHLGEVALLASGPARSQEPPLVLLHGFLTTKEFWRPFMQSLPAHWRILAPDLWPLACPAEGNDGVDFQRLAEHLEALRLRLAAPRLHVAAQDLGILVLLRYAYAYPHALHKALFFSPGLYPDLALPTGLQWWRRPVAGSLMSGALFPRALQRYFDRGAVRPADARPIYAAALQAFRTDAGRRCLGRWIRWGQPHHLFWDHPRMLRALRQPSLVFYGDANPFIHYSQAERLGHHLEDVRVVYLPGCGHFPTLEMPERVRQETVAFFERAPPPVRQTLNRQRVF